MEITKSQSKLKVDFVAFWVKVGIYIKDVCGIMIDVEKYICGVD
jgi:hypothetical protein